jgi:hypothetical protein
MMRTVLAALLTGAACAVALAQAQDTTSQAPPQNATPPMQVAPENPAPEAAPAPPVTAAPHIITRPQQAASEPERAPPATSDGRYRFNRVGTGFLRFDNESGQVAYCSAPTANWSCEAVPENRAALEVEIGRLHKEIDDLKKQIAALQAAPSPPPAPKAPPEVGPRPPESVPPATGGEIKLNLPTQQDLDRAATFLQDTWRRLVEMIVNLQKDAMRRS